MKNILKTLVVLFIAISFVSCEKTNETEVLRNQIVNDLLGHTYLITDYNEDGTDRSMMYESTRLTFNANDSLVFNNVAKEYVGSWKVIIDNNNSTDTGFSFLYFSMTVESIYEFTEILSTNWDILDFTGTQLKLQNGANYLTLDKEVQGKQ